MFNERATALTIRRYRHDTGTLASGDREQVTIMSAIVH